MNSSKTTIIAICGGSGAGKSWLVNKLLKSISVAAKVVRLDDFYEDRSHLTPKRRELVNYDHPRAIDWMLITQVLIACKRGEEVRIPCYDFKTHTRTDFTTLNPTPLLLVEGLWLLKKPKIRELFDLKVFIECPTETRFQRRLKRDVRSRGRTRKSVEEQFKKQVDPMHQQFIEPQKRLADKILKSPLSNQQLKQLTIQLELLLE